MADGVGRGHGHVASSSLPPATQAQTMSSVGKVYLVGAGPGDPELLTLKAARLLRQAQAVVYDRLVSEEILQLIPDGVSRFFVGKESGRHVLPQDEINQLVANLALAGHSVVRLKGGDPFVFGRGAEEALFLRQHGVPFEVVPGITAAVACAAYAGIPVTHRAVASGVQWVTGHCRGTVPLDLDWKALVNPKLTLVIYMGLSNLDSIRDGLLGAGRDPNTPVAVISNGTLGSQHRLLTNLDALCREVATSRIKAPALIIVGDVVELAHQLDWFEPSASAPRAITAAAGER